ncbi:MAG: glycosyltransferase family 4 protein [Gemmataceae bacterium]|nr:glycosyltransferase family 4 protein [Gemmataceae bacterium]MDW8267388.1 glycosyltransferase family 4 protein [Gemmataceae bacterium]
MLTEVQTWARGAVEQLAPRGSRRRHLLRWAKRLLQRWRTPATPPVIGPVLDIHNEATLRQHTRQLAPRFCDWTPADASADLWGAARLIVGLLRRDASLRRRFPEAVRQGPTGPYARWLTNDGRQELGLDERAVHHIQEAFRRGLADRVVQAYEHLPCVRNLYPLALTPAGRLPFLQWLLQTGRAEHRIREEEIAWFLQESAEDPAQGIVATFLRRPEWQRACPYGLTIFGQQELLRWIRRHYGLRQDWLERVVFPAFGSPGDELRLFYHGRPELRQVAPKAFRDPKDTARLLEWLDQHSPVPIPKPWRDQLRDEWRSGKLCQLGVNVLGHFRYTSGLQQAACATVRALATQQVRTSCRDVPALPMHDLPNRADYLGLELFDTTIILTGPDRPAPTYYELCGWPERPNVYRIGFWAWELETLPPAWVSNARYLDEIWTLSEFSARAIRAAVDVPVRAMGIPVEVPSFPVLPRSHFALPDDKFLFLFVFDMASILERKNPLAIIQAFERAFAGRPDVGLVIKYHRGEVDPGSTQRLRAAAERVPGVVLLDQTLSRLETYALMQVCDCYVSLHRAEGFGLTMAEAMLLGKPVIATNYSGNLDFMNSDNSLLVDYRRVPIAQTLPIYPQGAVWAEPSVEHAAALMRWVEGHRAEALALGARAQAQLRQQLAPATVGRRMAERLAEPHAPPARRQAA